MEIKFGRTTWEPLRKVRDATHGRATRGKYYREIRDKMLAGFADAIDAELTRREMAGERTGGMVTLSIDLKIEPYRLVEYEPEKRRNLLAELDDILHQQPAK